MPRSIEQLSKLATMGSVQPDAPLERYLSSASKLAGEGYDRFEQGDMESAFIYLLRFVTLVFEQLKHHPDWRAPKTHEQRNKKRLYTDQAKTAMDQLEVVKRELISVQHTDDAIRRREAQLAAMAKEEEARRLEQARKEQAARAAEAEAEARRQAATRPPPLDPSRLLAILGQSADGGWARGHSADGRARSLYPSVAPDGNGMPSSPSYLSFMPPQQQYPPAAARAPSALATVVPPPPAAPPGVRLPGDALLISTEPEPQASAALPTAADELIAALAEAPSLPLHGAELAPPTDGHRAAAAAGDSQVADAATDATAEAADAASLSSEVETLADDEPREESEEATGTSEQPPQPAAAAAGHPSLTRPEPGGEQPQQPQQPNAQGARDERDDGRTPVAAARPSAYPNSERPHTSFAVGKVPNGPIKSGGPPPAEALLGRHAIGAPPPPKLSDRPAPTTQDQRLRLRHHLELRGFVEEPVPGDGNCQFHALVDQLQQNGVPPISAKALRAKAVQWLEQNANRPMDDGTSAGGTSTLKESIGVDDWPRYLSDMRKHGVTWGDEGTLLAVSVLYRAEIVVISSLSEEYCHIVHPPPAWKVPLRMRLYLGHYHEFHYVSVRFAS